MTIAQEIAFSLLVALGLVAASKIAPLLLWLMVP
jgi:hypothetical protein